MIIEGSVFRLPADLLHDVNTDAILPSPYLRVPEDELGRHVFAGVVPGFPVLARDRQILVAGRNFGCGSSREQAPKALWSCGFRAVLAVSFASIFFRNAINLGLGAIVVPGPALEALATGDRVAVDAARGEILVAGGESHACEPLPDHLLRLLTAGGLLPYLRTTMDAR